MKIENMIPFVSLSMISEAFFPSLPHCLGLFLNRIRAIRRETREGKWIQTGDFQIYWELGCHGMSDLGYCGLMFPE